MFAFIITVHVLVSIFLIFVILLQPGKGDGMGSLGGGGGTAQAVFGGRGSVTFLAKVTTACAVIFMLTSLTLAYRSSHSASVLRARRNLATQDTKKADDKDKGLSTATPGAQAVPAPATGGAIVPVPVVPAGGPAQPALTPPPAAAPAPAPKAAAPAPAKAPPAKTKAK